MTFFFLCVIPDLFRDLRIWVRFDALESDYFEEEILLCVQDDSSDFISVLKLEYPYLRNSAVVPLCVRQADGGSI
ncbi:hypothetical protein [Ekhidna sp.]|uniref:hypothetical protein n=1 Tax=Ekhidna sp. TaxID=2608089 RepID=UPI0035110A8D